MSTFNLAFYYIIIIIFFVLQTKYIYVFFFLICRYCFPYSLQMALLLRFMMDNTQTPNSRVKVALLNYLTALVRDMQPSDLTAVTSQSGSPGALT